MRSLLALLPLILLAATTVPAKLAPLPPGTQCVAGEAVMYSGHFGKSVGSVCMAAKSVSYRFGPLGHPSIDIRSNADWSNVHSGSLYSHALAQDYVRFTSNGYDYVIFTSEAGENSDVSGKHFSGIAVIHGTADVVRLDCRGKAIGPETWMDDIRGRALEATCGRADLTDEDPRFDQYF